MDIYLRHVEYGTDNKLLARIRQSDEEALYMFCFRHWKLLYTHALAETGNEDEAFERLKGRFAELWDRRSHLPEMTTTVEEYVFRDVSGKPEKNGAVWNLANVVEEMRLRITGLPYFFGNFLGDKFK